MIAIIRPGGTIRSVNVTLRHNETLPNKFNTREAVVFREREDDPRELILVKPENTVLPADSPLLTQPELPGILDLTKGEESASMYDHVDIIRFDDGEEK